MKLKDISRLKIKQRSGLPDLPAYFLILLSFILYTVMGIVMHERFATSAFDLGIYDQVVWLYANFDAPQSSIKELSQLGDHFGPVLVLFAPFYWIWQDPRMLLILQAALATSSGIPVYLYARERLSSRYIAFSILLAYLLFPGMQFALSFDFHLATISIFFIAWTFYFALTRRYLLMWIAMILAIFIKEDISLIMGGLGLFLLMQKDSRKTGAAITALAAICFIAIQFWLMPHFGSRGEYLNIAIWEGGPKGMLWGMLTEPWKVFAGMLNNGTKRHTIFEMLSSWQFIPALSPFTWLTGAPNFLERFLSSYSGRWQIYWHYSVNIAPSFAFGTVMVISFLSKRWPLKRIKKERLIAGIATLILAVILMQQTVYDRPILKMFTNNTWRESSEDSRELVKQVPAGAAVIAQASLVPHLSQRPEIYAMGMGASTDEELYAKSTYIVFDGELDPFPFTPEQLQTKIRACRLNPELELFYSRGKTYIFKRTI